MRLDLHQRPVALSVHDYSLSGSLLSHALRKACLGLVLFATASCVGGCQTTIHRAPVANSFGDGIALHDTLALSGVQTLVASRNNATFFPADARALDQNDPLIASRVEGLLGYRSETTLFEADSWHGAPKRTLSRTRYFYLPERANTQIYFETEQRGRTSRGIQYGTGTFDPRN